jgi:hypothetical protein
MRSAANILFKLARALLTLAAVLGGRVIPRVCNIVIGRTAGRLLSRLWR